MRARVLELARGGLAALEANRQRIDDLNVYPVPDGDTGTNMTLTVRAVVEAIERSSTEDRAALANEITRAALMGARGNSGVILSQAIRGAAESLRDSDDIARALRGAADAAYRAIKKPVEGTMLTALRELAEEAERGSDLAAIVARGDDCVVRTTDMLAQLKQAGVVDAGAAGSVESSVASQAWLTGELLPGGAPAKPRRSASATRSSTRSSRATATARSSSSRAKARRGRDRGRAGADRRPSCSSSAISPALKVHGPPMTQGRRCRWSAREGRSAASRSRTCMSRRRNARSACSEPSRARRPASAKRSP